ncbi:MAG: hypothetical protein HQL52_11885 [Magnetococcales bacterium]|nr:hypothetical protein [Magnetococcales bacterium]
MKTKKLRKVLGRLWIDIKGYAPEVEMEVLVTDGKDVEIGHFDQEGVFRNRVALGKGMENPSHWLPVPRMPE